MNPPTSRLISPPISHSDLRTFGEEKVNLPADVAKERRERVNDLRDRLTAWMKVHPDCGLVKSYFSGSLAKGLALRATSDVDVALYVRYDGERKADRRLADWIASRLRRAYPQMAPEQVQPQDHSVRIIFKGADVDVDIVPVFYDDDPQDRGWLVSKHSGRLVSTSIPMHLEFTRKRKAAQPLHFAQVVRLLKWWRDEQKAKNGAFRLKSFIIELICAHLADGGQAMSDHCRGMEAFFNYIVRTGLKSRIAFTDYYQASKLPASLPDAVQILDPVNPMNNVACQYDENHRRLIVTAAQDALDALNEAHTAATKTHALPLWQEVLGKTFRC